MGVGHDNLLGLKTFAQVWEIIRESKIIPSEKHFGTCNPTKFEKVQSY